MTGLSKNKINAIMSFCEEEYDVKMVTNVSGHKGNASSPNFTWKGAKIIPTARLLDSVTIIIVNGIQLEHEAEKTYFKYAADVSEIGLSMAEAFVGKMKTDTVLVIR